MKAKIKKMNCNKASIRQQGSGALVLRSFFVALGLLLTVVMTTTITPSDAFGPAVADRRHVKQQQQQQRVAPSVRLFSSSSSSSSSKSDASDGQPEEEEYPALSEDEIRNLLDAVPVYAVTETNKAGIVLLKEEGNDNEIANFFFSPEIANQVYAPLRQQDSDSWDVTQFSLGMVWFDLFKNPPAAAAAGGGSSPLPVQENGIEYRLFPDGRDLAEARNIVEQTARQTFASSAGSKIPSILIPDNFIAPWNEIPVFVDQFLRARAPDNNDDDEEIMMTPVYFGYPDIIATRQQAAEATSGEYQASINVADLRVLIGQMQSTSQVNFRQTIMIPPMPRPAGEMLSTTNAIEPELQRKSEEMELPAATKDLWLD